MPDTTDGRRPRPAPGPSPSAGGSGGGARLRRDAAAGAAQRRLFRGLRAGDLQTILLTVAMAAEDNRMPAADPDEEARILAFLKRLAAQHDGALALPTPSSPGGPGADPGG